MLSIATLALALLIGIWIGYPLVMAVVPRFAPSSPGDKKATASGQISVIIATREAGEALQARVQNLREVADAASAPLEIVVGCDHAAGLEPALAMASGPGVRAVAGDAPGGKAATLNAAVAAARGDLLVFTDTAQVFERETIPRLLQGLTQPSVAIVSGALQLERPGERPGLAAWYWRLERWLRWHEARVHSTVGVTGAVYAMRREAWRPLPVGLILDDVYTPMRIVLAGGRVGFRPDAVAFDDRRFSAPGEANRKARTLTGVLQLCAWLPGILDPRRNPIWTQFVLHKLARFLTPYLLLVAALGAALALAGWLRGAPAAARAAVLGVLALAAALVGLVRPLREAVRMALALQVAVLRATRNGLRGEWDVWTR